MNAAELSGLFFLDTNIFVYSFDLSAPIKQQIARQWIEDALRTQRGIISTQIIQEFLNVALRKFVRPMNGTESREYIKIVLSPLCQHYPSLAFYDHALLLQQQTGFSFYDSLVVTAAVETGCRTLLSEDLQNGRIIEGMTIRNPFLVA
ncbi:MAG: PIN domain-containing protein [Chloroflexi bacterium]|nr:PIN domain-containing protein [Chloroflexota bacterium]